MHKTSIIFAAAIAAFGSTVAVANTAPTRFVRDGVTYEYTAKVAGNRQILTGRTLTSGQPFRLVIENGHVRGTASGVPVAFDLAEVKPGNTLIASR